MNAYLICEASIFFCHYYKSGVPTRTRKLPRSDDKGGDEQPDDDDNEILDIILYFGRYYGKLKTTMFSDEEFNDVHAYILLNEDKMKPFIE